VVGGSVFGAHGMPPHRTRFPVRPEEDVGKSEPSTPLGSDIEEGSRSRSRSGERQYPNSPEGHSVQSVHLVSKRPCSESGSVQSLKSEPVFGGSHGPRLRIPSPTGSVDSRRSKPTSGGFMDCSCVHSPKACTNVAERSCSPAHSADSGPEVSGGCDCMVSAPSQSSSGGSSASGGSTSDAEVDATAQLESKPLPTRLRSLPCLCDVGFVEFQQTLNISYCQSHNSHWQVGVCSWCGRQLSATATTSPRCQNASTENAGACAG